MTVNDKETTMSKDEVVAVSKIQRTSGGLRNCLFDEIDGVRDGSSSPARARAVSSLVNTTLKSVLMEIEYQKYADSLKASPSHSLGNLSLSN